MNQSSETGTDDPLSLVVNEGQDRRTEGIYGAIISAAIADALGWVTEFMRSPAQLKDYYGVEKLVDFVTWEKKTGGRFNTYIDRVEEGNYSDDTQLTLCTARSLRPDGTFDAEYFTKKELPAWLDYARGGGYTVLTAARMAGRRSVTWNSNFFSYRTADHVTDYRNAGANGVVMRIGPLVLANLDRPELAERAIWHNAITTHGHPRAIVGALFYGAALGTLAREESPTFDRFLTSLRNYLLHLKQTPVPESLASWRTRWDASTPGTFDHLFRETVEEMRGLMDLAVADRKEPVSDVLRRLGCFERATRGSGTATAAAALAIFLRYGKSIEHAVTKAVNLIGSDTDTIGALVGGLAGAFCGYSSIPERWAVRLQDLDYFQRVCDSVLRICNRTDRSSGLEVDQSERWASFPRITDVVQKRTVRTNQRVSHPILGPGWVRSTYSQAIRRKGGGTVVFSRVVFDIGQSCVFHSKAGSVGQPKGEQSEDDGPEDPEE